MKNSELLDLYSDYLISTFGQATATGFSALLRGIERGTVSQIAQAKCFVRKIAHTITVRTQTNHFFASLCGYIKLESVKGKTQLNHFALKSKLYLATLQSAYAAWQEFLPATLATPATLAA
jgi:hypothetical protein